MSPGEQFAAPEIERWWLVFTPPVEPGWWRVFLSPGFGHVYAFRMPKNGICIALNPLIHRVENAIVMERASEWIERALAEGHKVLVFERHTQVYRSHIDVRVGRGWFITCASYLAYTLGIDFSWRCTPRQLWKAALKAGAQELQSASGTMCGSAHATIVGHGQGAVAPTANIAG